MASIFPFLNITETTENTELPIFKEVAWNYETDTPILQDGEPVIVEKNEALKVWIYKALKTERYIYMAHTWRYGAETESLIGTSLTPSAAKSEIKRYVTEALLVNPYISELKDFSVTYDGDIVTVAFKTITVYGEVSINV